MVRTLGLLMAVFALLGMQGCGSGSSATGVSAVTLDQLAATWDIMGSGTQNVGVNQCFGICGVSFAGTITINPNGSVSMSRTNHNSGTADTSVSDNGTLNVSPIGHGTLSFTSSGEVYEIQFSRNLEVATFANITSGGVFISGMAVRR